MRGVAGGNTRPRWATTDNELVEQLRACAARPAELVGGLNDLLRKAAAALEAADTIQTRGGDGLREALEEMLRAERRRYDDTPEAQAFYEKNNAKALAALTASPPTPQVDAGEVLRAALERLLPEISQDGKLWAEIEGQMKRARFPLAGLRKAVAGAHAALAAAPPTARVVSADVLGVLEPFLAVEADLSEEVADSDILRGYFQSVDITAGDLRAARSLADRLGREG